MELFLKKNFNDLVGTYVALGYSNSFRVSPTKHELNGIIKYPIVKKEPKSSKLLLMMR
jgi:hypothetical protein